jgi:hypothetical protein
MVDIFQLAHACFSVVTRMTMATRINCGRVPVAAAPNRDALSNEAQCWRRRQQSAAKSSALKNPAAGESLKTFVAVIQTAGVIVRHAAIHQASRSVNCNLIMRNHAATKSAPPRLDTRYNEVSGSVAKNFVAIHPKKMNSG